MKNMIDYRKAQRVNEMYEIMKRFENVVATLIEEGKIDCDYMPDVWDIVECSRDIIEHVEGDNLKNDLEDLIGDSVSN